MWRVNTLWTSMASARAPLLLQLLLHAAILALLHPIEAKSMANSAKPCLHKARNQTGVCRPLPSCPSALRELKSNMYPQLCGFMGGSRVPEVCCPLVAVDNRVEMQPGGAGDAVDTFMNEMNCRHSLEVQKKQQLQGQLAKPGGRRRPGATARQKCREYVQYVCSEAPSAALMLGNRDITDRCQYRVELISGGKQVNAMEFPHMVLLGYGDRDEPEFACGGSLISPEYVLTAAHCQASRPLGLQVRWALLGTLHRSTTPHPNPEPQMLQISEIIVHPDYRSSLRYNDIALLRLARPAAMDDFVRPACLHTDLDGDPTGVNAIATGWGATGDAEDQSDFLLKVNLPVTTFDSCRQVFNGSTNDQKLARGIIPSQLCAGGEFTRDTCPGDSGGPLQVPTNSDPYCQYKVVGIVSFGPPCGIGIPGVYTRVASYVPWIESIVWPDDGTD